jgi:hypothetical protein
MKKMNFKNILFSAALAAGAMSLASCSLEEENPGGFTMENMAANSVESYQTLLNQCYFGRLCSSCVIAFIQPFHSKLQVRNDNFLINR